MRAKILVPMAFSTLAGTALAQAPLYDLFSTTAGDALGSSVVGLGDVDGDGFGDLAVGVKHATGTQADSGVVHIYSGRDGTQIRVIDGERTGDWFGHSLATLGDVDGDGRGDLSVGAPKHEWTSGTDRGGCTCSRRDRRG